MLLLALMAGKRTKTRCVAADQREGGGIATKKRAELSVLIWYFVRLSVSCVLLSSG